MKLGIQLLISVMIFVMNFHPCFSQQQASTNLGTVTWGLPIQDSNRYGLAQFIGLEKGTGCSYWLSYAKDITLIEKFNADNDRVFSMPINQLDLPGTATTQQVRVQRVIMTKYSFCILSRYYNRKTRQTSLFIHQLSKEGNLIKGPLRICDLQGISSLEFKISPDSLKLILGVGIIRNATSPKNKFQIRTFDLQLNQLYSIDVNLCPNETLDSQDVEVLQSAVSRANQFYFTSKPFVGLNASGGETLWALNLATGRVTATEPEIGHRIDFTRFSIDAHQDVIAYGLYSKDDSSKVYSGLFYSRLDPSRKLFDSFTIATFPDEMKIARVDQSSPELNCLFKTDNGMILFVEVVKGSMYRFTTGPVLVFNFNPKDQLLYKVSVPKLQTFYIFAPYSQYSFFPIYSGRTKRINLIFNDNRENLEDPPPDRIFSMIHPKHSVPVVVTLDERGTMTKSRLTEDTHGIVLSPLLCIQVSSHEALIVGRKQREFGMGTLRFE